MRLCKDSGYYSCKLSFPVNESKIYTQFSFFIVLPSVVACNNKHKFDFPKVIVSDPFLTHESESVL